MKQNSSLLGITVPIKKVYMSKREVCAYLDVSRRWLEDRVANGEIPYSRIGDKFFIKVKDVDNYVELNRVI